MLCLLIVGREKKEKNRNSHVAFSPGQDTPCHIRFSGLLGAIKS
jgi:hypothetical protein